MAKSKKPSIPSKWKGTAISALGSVPMKGVIKKGAQALKKTAKAAKKKVSNTKKKVVASLKIQKKPAQKKKTKKIVKKRGKVFTKARKLKNNLTKKEQINKLKKTMNKTVLAAKSIPKKVTKQVKDHVKDIASFAVDMVPYVGTAKAFQQATAGVDLITGQKLSTGDRIAEGVGVVTSVIPIPGMKHVGKYGTKGIIEAGEFIADVSTNFVKKTKGKVDEIPSKPSKPSKVTRYDDVKIINKKYAGQTYNLSGDLSKKYPNGVKFTNDGFPDFSSYSKAKVKINGLKGNTSSDFTAANKAIGLKSTPSGYTWHHVEDGRTLMLVPTDLHQAVRHTGGAALIRKGLAP